MDSTDEKKKWIAKWKNESFTSVIIIYKQKLNFDIFPKNSISFSESIKRFINYAYSVLVCEAPTET